MAKESLTKKEATKLLKELVPNYGEVKTAFDIYKKEEKELNLQIKEVMRKASITSNSADGYTVEYSTRESEKYDEEGLLEFMHKHEEFTPCIKVKEYFDENVLESLMYKGEIPKNLQAELAKFRTKTVTEVLKVKKG